MTDLIKEKIERLRIMRESASRRTDLYSDMGKLDDKKTTQSLGALNRASAPGRKMQKLGFLMLWIPEPTGVEDARRDLLHGVGTPVVDEDLTVDEESYPVVGGHEERIEAGVFGDELSGPAGREVRESGARPGFRDADVEVDV